MDQPPAVLGVPGRRAPDDTELEEGRPGDYWLAGGHWWVVTPSGDLGNLDGWDITVHEDESITAKPSIKSDHWHGYLEAGKWVRCE